MQKVHAAQALTNLGLAGDRHAKAGGSRQVLFMPSEVLARLGVPIGAVKENVTTQGIDLMTLASGTRLQIGAAVFEITKLCEPCERMDEIRAGLRAELEGQRGMLARVVQGGPLSVGDPIEVLPRGTE